MQSGSDTAADKQVTPIPAWVICVPTFMLATCQTMLLTAVTLEVDETAFKERFHSESVHIWQFETETQLALIFIVQITMHSELAHSVEMLIFFTNPVNWSRRARVNESHNCHAGSWICSPLVALACAMKCIIAYWTTVCSISIIFLSENLGEATFNCLALGFITDLDDRLYKLIQNSFMLKILSKGVEVDMDGRLFAKDRKPSLDQEWFARKFDFRLLEQEPGEDNRWSQVRSRGHWRRLLAALIVFFMYTNCIFLTVNVLRTGWLPAAQQACWLRRAILNSDRGWCLELARPLVRVVFGKRGSRCYWLRTLSREVIAKSTRTSAL